MENEIENEDVQYLVEVYYNLVKFAINESCDSLDGHHKLALMSTVGCALMARSQALLTMGACSDDMEDMLEKTIELYRNSFKNSRKQVLDAETERMQKQTNE